MTHEVSWNTEQIKQRLIGGQIIEVFEDYDGEFFGFTVSRDGGYVRVWVDGEPVAHTGCAHPRLDVKAAFSKVDHAVYTGFHTRLRVPRARVEREARLEVTVETADHPSPLARFERTLRIRPLTLRASLARRIAKRLPPSVRRALGRSAALRRIGGMRALPASADPRPEDRE